ncbi:MAG: hypothetical protein A3K60_02085 [Euryarchaeota archaeon RBG_19FT_COMBO_56_21]|nr:MAG: hypothetical protein A3K60_02085 [Euryarchaeota archaeon RBG_19FT_COMBO_56_21]
MIKNLFTKHDHRPIAEITKEEVMHAASYYWRFNNFGISFSSPYSMQGSQYFSKLGLRQSISIYLVEEGPQIGVDLSLSAELTDEGAALGIVGAILILPVTVAVGAVSYIEYDNDAQRLMNGFWQYLYGFKKNPKPPTGQPYVPSWAQGQTAPQTAQPQTGMPRACPKCGTQVDSTDVFCKKCGAKF